MPSDMAGALTSRTNGSSSSRSYKVGHNYIGHNYIGHNYIGHNYIGHNYTGHNYIGHNYVCGDLRGGRP